MDIVYPFNFCTVLKCDYNCWWNCEIPVHIVWDISERINVVLHDIEIAVNDETFNIINLDSHNLVAYPSSPGLTIGSPAELQQTI